MGIGEKLEPILIKLGRNNKPTLVAMGVATAKGIFRPIFTMADKKQDEDTKKYTALREGLTELIAIPVYWGSGKLAECLSKKFAKPKDMPIEVFKKIINKESNATNLTESAKTIRKNVFKSCTTLSMLGVFLSALLVIPAVCSATIKPLMKTLQKTKQNSPENKTEIAKNTSVEPAFKGYTYRRINPYCNTYSVGMKVGGIW